MRDLDRLTVAGAAVARAQAVAVASPARVTNRSASGGRCRNYRSEASKRRLGVLSPVTLADGVCVQFALPWAVTRAAAPAGNVRPAVGVLTAQSME